MRVLFDRSFNKAIKKIDNKSILSSIKKVIIECEKAKLLKDISNVKKLKGHKRYYRIKIKSYRAGFEYYNDTITFITILHRKDIYNKFP